MRKKYWSLTVALLLFSILANSQADPKKTPAIKFQSNLQPGILIGQSGSNPAFTISSINGIQSKSWFAGIGIGLDYYGAKRSVPLFIDVKKDLSEKVNTFFLFADAGYNFPWLMDNQKMKFVEKYNASGGLYYETGIGYKFKIFTNTHIGFSAGYSFKQIKEEYTYPCIWCENEIPPDEISNYKYRRLAIKLNWWLR